ncbi:MAG: hypothetical protein ABIJ26_03515 [Candidatus Margulisiibacteriota bacterium]|nr:hypothetical protein [Candidatus Margulisiibacteriota bacterium]
MSDVLSPKSITFDDFKKLDIRLGVIKSVEEIEGADKIYKLTVDIGEERTLVAGVKPYYAADELVGKKVAVLANLEPRTIRGVESHGMVLCAHTSVETGCNQSLLACLTVERDLPPGAVIS